MKENLHLGFVDLEVWKKARVLKVEIMALTVTFPKEEKYRLTEQIIRSIRSVNANIAEGHGRLTNKDQIHFCVIARGSLSETYNHLIDAFDSEYIDEDILFYFKKLIVEVVRLLNGYIAYLRKNL